MLDGAGLEALQVKKGAEMVLSSHSAARMNVPRCVCLQILSALSCTNSNEGDEKWLTCSPTSVTASRACFSRASWGHAKPCDITIVTGHADAAVPLLWLYTFTKPPSSRLPSNQTAVLQLTLGRRLRGA